MLGKGKEMTPDKLTTVCQILTLIFGIFALISGYGIHYFGSKSSDLKDAAVTAYLQRLQPPQEIIAINAITKINEAGGRVESSELFKPGRKVTFYKLSKPFSSICDTLAEIPNLCEIRFNREQWSKADFSIDDFAAVSKLKSLRALDLPQSNIADLSPIEHLPELEVLLLRNNNVTDLRPIAALDHLWWLDIDGNPVDDLTPLVNCRRLEILSVGSTKVTNLQPLISLPKLRILDVYGFHPNESDQTPVSPEERDRIFNAKPNLKAYPGQK